MTGLSLAYSTILENALNDRDGFWNGLDELVASSDIIIDRPKGSTHPRYPGQFYPVDYGYLEQTTAGDGAEIDVFTGSLQPAELDALILTVDLLKRDSEIKLLLGCSKVEQEIILKFLRGGEFHPWLISRQSLPELLHKRRSVRRFQNRPIPREILAQVIESATWAPSAHNRQPWQFVILESQESKVRLAEAMGAELARDLIRDGNSPQEAQAQVTRSRQRIEQAPAAILLCLDPSQADHYPDARRQAAEHVMSIQSVAMAGENLLLAAHAVGLGGVWMCAPLFTPQSATEALDLPAHWQPQGLVLLGYPAGIPPVRPRRSLSEISITR